MFKVVLYLKVDAKSNIAKLVEIPIELLSPSNARDQFAKVLSALPCGASQMPCQMLTAGIVLKTLKE